MSCDHQKASPSINKFGHRIYRWAYLFVSVMVLFLVLNFPPTYAASTRTAEEQEIKAAYLYNFLLFVDFPETENKLPVQENSKPPALSNNSIVQSKFITIGILGTDLFGKVFGKVEGKKILGTEKRLAVKRYGPYRKGMRLDDCRLLFISASEKKNFKYILAGLQGMPILTVSDTEGFLETGGMINLKTLGKKVRWSINLTPAEEAGVKLDIQLLRSAIDVIRVPQKTDGTPKQP